MDTLFSRGYHTVHRPPHGDIFGGTLYWDVGEVGKHAYVMPAPHAALSLTQ